MSECIIKIKQGEIKGKIFEDAQGRKRFAFLGIPYAKPPLENLRFKAPEPAEPWSGIRDATKEGSPCKSRHSEKYHVQGCEDGLFLNVYTPEVPKESESKRFAVMVFIHGGGFHLGSSTADTYGPDFILTENIIFVSINYRVGIFGFLSFKDPSLEIPGNAGLKDQVLALKWIRGNIDSFGGDPENVTIFGQSAGAASVHYLLLSPLTKGLFQKAILQSGCAINCWASSDGDFSTQIAEHMGIPGAKEKQILEELNRRSSDELLELQEKINEASSKMHKRPWVPVIEKPSPNALISQTPLEVISSGSYNKVPIIIGYTDREGIFARILQSQFNIELFPKDFEHEVLNVLKLTEGSQECRKAAKALKNFYFGNEEPTEKNIDSTFLLKTDTWFVRGIYKALKSHLLTNLNPAYYYRFSIDGRLNFMKYGVNNLKDVGACHADDLGYLFKSEWTPAVIPNSAEELTRKRVIRLWTNFAKYGNPNGHTKDNLLKVEWLPATSESLHYLEIGENLTVGVEPDQERMDFYDNLEKEFGSTI